LCLAVPMKVKNIRWPIAEVSAQGLIKDVDIQLVPKVDIGDYVLVHAGFAIQIMDKDLARESLEIWEALEF
jgi:hydrogenase expression/formation protein HypC